MIIVKKNVQKSNIYLVNYCILKSIESCATNTIYLHCMSYMTLNGMYSILLLLSFCFVSMLFVYF